MSIVSREAALALRAMGFPFRDCSAAYLYDGQVVEAGYFIVSADDFYSYESGVWHYAGDDFIIAAPDALTALAWLEEAHGIKWECVLRRGHRGRGVDRIWRTPCPRCDEVVSTGKQPSDLIVAIDRHNRLHHAQQHAADAGKGED